MEGHVSGVQELPPLPSECLPFSIIPHSSRLFLDYLYDFRRVAEFYPRPPLPSEWFSAEASRIVYPTDRRERVVAALRRQNERFGSGEAAQRNLQRLGEGAVAVVTGQQVGLFGGPLFALLKAISAVRLADEATRAGVDAVPVFWLATEDHDIDEIDGVYLPGKGWLRATPEGRRGSPVSEIRLGADVAHAVAAARDTLGDSEVAGWLADAYRPGETFGDAFGRLFAGIFRDFGVILLDASDPELHAVAAPVYLRAVEAAAEIDYAVLERGRQLRDAGYHEQVKVTAESTLLFAKIDGIRTPIHRNRAELTVGGARLNAVELMNRIEGDPAQFSPNVLLRPVAQDHLLPTLAYVGGPAEIAYFAQGAAVYAKLAGRITPVLPRFSATIVDAKAAKLMAKYQLRLTDLFEGAAATRETIARLALPAEVHHRFDAASADTERHLEALRQALASLDPTLMKAAERASAKMRYQLERLRGRTARAEMRRKREIAGHAEYLTETLFPNDALQERSAAGVWALARFGPELLQQLYDAVSIGCPGHQVLTP